MLNSFFCL